VRLGIPALDALWTRHGGRLEITGHGGLPLLYHIVSAVVAPMRSGTIVIVDVDGRFDVSRLSCSLEDLQHVHVVRPAKGMLKETLGQLDTYLLGGKHGSMSRELVATVVNGSQGGDISVSWRGWLKAESEIDEVPRFGMGISVEEALTERDNRQEAIENKGWRAESEWGDYRWKGS
jgi:hypothetical protein